MIKMSSTLRCINCITNRRLLLKTATLKVCYASNIQNNLQLQRSYSQLLRPKNASRRNIALINGNSIFLRNFSLESNEIPPDPVSSSDLGIQTIEPSFQSLGLGGNTPPGLVQQGLEYLHITCDLPWWGCVALGTCLIRLVVFPVAILAQRNMASMANTMPQIQELQMKMSDARKRGNELEARHYASKMASLWKEKSINPFKSFLTPIVQMPVFISFFLALRGMADLPIESLHNGGLFWFTDLTVPDPYYLLPSITSLTLLATIEVGMDTGVTPNQMGPYLKYIFRAIPVIMFPIIIHFEGIILVYWLSTNVITLIQTSLLKVTAIREFFGIEKVIPFRAEFQFSTRDKPQSFSEGFKESFSNLDKSHEIEERKRVDELIKRQTLSAKTVKNE